MASRDRGRRRSARPRRPASRTSRSRPRSRLKDFRDRRGDALHGKRTILLCHGKDATCALCLAALVAGDALLTAALPVHAPAAVAAYQALFAGVVVVLVRSWRTADELREQVGIGLGAKLGNGALLSVLGLLVLWGAGASPAAEAFFGWCVALAFLADVALLARRPPAVLVGYRGLGTLGRADPTTQRTNPEPGFTGPRIKVGASSPLPSDAPRPGLRPDLPMNGEDTRDQPRHRAVDVSYAAQDNLTMQSGVSSTEPHE